MILTALAILPLPEAAQTVLARHHDSDVRVALSMSPHLEPTVANVLARDRDWTVRRHAYTKVSDPDLLREALEPGRGHVAAEFAALNPLALPELLVRALDDKRRHVALSAFRNPLIPLSRKRVKLSAKRAEELVCVGGSTADHMVRAFELVAANPWMADTASAWPAMVRRALCGLPDLSEGALTRIRNAGTAGRKAIKVHPRTLGINPAETQLEELVEIGSPALDLWVAEHADTSLSLAATLLARSTPPEPYVIARILNRFGPASLIGSDGMQSVASSRWSGTRVDAVSWLSPVLDWVTHETVRAAADLQLAVARLGNDQHRWNTFVALVPEWHGRYADAATAAGRL